MAVSPVPAGHHTVTPHMVLRNAAQAIEFYKKAFGAVEMMRMPGPEGKGIGHAELKIGDSFVYLADEWPGTTLAAPEKFGGTTVSMVIDSKLENPTLPAVETSTPSTNVRAIDQVM